MVYKILNMACKLRGLKNIAYLKAILKRIDLARELFMMDVQQMEPTQIPTDLKQSDLPFSMRYYDPIIAIVQENV